LLLSLKDIYGDSDQPVAVDADVMGPSEGVDVAVLVDWLAAGVEDTVVTSSSCKTHC